MRRCAAACSSTTVDTVIGARNIRHPARRSRRTRRGAGPRVSGFVRQRQPCRGHRARGDPDGDQGGTQRRRPSGDQRRRTQVRGAVAWRQGGVGHPHPARRSDPSQPRRKGCWQIAQMPQVESAFIAVRPADGAILSLVGGFDFDRNKFNHVTQALRQPGSAFKPFIYSAALEKGFSPATVVNDAPLYFEAAQTGGDAWEPKNYDGKFEGPMRLRTALMKSKNLVTVRVMQAIDAAVRAGLHRAVRLRPEAASALPADGARRRRGDAAADGRRVRGLRQRRLSRHALPDRPRRRRQGNVLSKAEPAVAGENGRARDRSAQRLHHDDDDARRRPRRHRGASACSSAGRTSPARRGRPTRTSTPGSAASTPRCRRRLDRFRPAEDAGTAGDGRRGGAADLDGLHGQGRSRASRKFRSSRRTASSSHVSTRKRACARARAAITEYFYASSRRASGKTPSLRPGRKRPREVRNQLF